MKKETLRLLLLNFICSSFCVMMFVLAASFVGTGVAQVQQQPAPYIVPAMAPQPFGEPTQVPPQTQPYLSVQPISNNAMLPNQAQATYNLTTQEVKIPFEVDTSRWLAFSVVVDNSVQTLTVLDPVNQSLAVYHVYLSGPDAGKCELKSVRNIFADLKLYDYDSMKPLPKDIRAVVEQPKQ